MGKETQTEKLLSVNCIEKQITVKGLNMLNEFISIQILIYSKSL